MKRGTILAAAVLLTTSVVSSIFAQATNPAYLADFPSVDKVMTSMKVADPDETAARQMASFTWLMQMVLDLAGPRQFQRAPGGLTADETKLRNTYSLALYNIQQSNPKYNSIGAMHGLHTSLPFRNELIQKAFPPGYAAQYDKLQAQARQAAAQLHQQVTGGSPAQEAQQAQQARQQAQQSLQPLTPQQQAALRAQQQALQQQQEANVDPQMRQMRRCITAGRVMATCTGNALMGSLMPNVNGILSAALPGTVGKEVTGPQMAGVFAGNGWRLEFSEASVAVSCQDMIPDSHAYTISFANNRAVLDIAAMPKDIVLNVDGNTLTGAAAVPLTGRVSVGVTRGTTLQGQPADIYQYQQVTRNCMRPVLNATNSPGVVGTEQNMLVGLFNDGDSGPPTPPALRMNGTYAVASGFSVQFFPESVILGCGPDVARAYPYTVVADGKQAVVKVSAPDHPLTLLIKANNVLDSGTGPYIVEGRQVTGQNANGDYTFAPRNATCNLAALSSGQVPSTMAPVAAPAANR